MRRILGVPKVLEILNYKSRVSLDNLEKAGLLPPRIRVGPNRIGWREEDIEKFLASRAKGIAKEAVPVEEQPA